MTTSDTHRAIEAVWRIESARLIAGLARIYFLAKLGRFDEAGREFERAAGLTRNVRERELLLARAAACGRGAPPPHHRRVPASGLTRGNPDCKVSASP